MTRTLFDLNHTGGKYSLIGTDGDGKGGKYTSTKTGTGEKTIDVMPGTYNIKTGIGTQYINEYTVFIGRSDSSGQMSVITSLHPNPATGNPSVVFHIDYWMPESQGGFDSIIIAEEKTVFTMKLIWYDESKSDYLREWLINPDNSVGDQVGDSWNLWSASGKPTSFEAWFRGLMPYSSWEVTCNQPQYSTVTPSKFNLIEVEPGNTYYLNFSYCPSEANSCYNSSGEEICGGPGASGGF